MILTSDPFNAFLDRPPVAVASAEGGPLAGLRLAVKDIFDVEGWKTGCGNPQKLEEAEPAAKSAPAVETLLGAGATFVGKTQTDELAFSLFGRNSHFPHPVNPAAPGRITGGSSSGSAAAVAGNLADIALGSDTGGSVRAPAGFCGLFGLRPTHGRLPAEGVMPLARSLDTVGFFARDGETFARVAEVLFEAPAAEGGPVRLMALDDLDGRVLPQAAGGYARLKTRVADALGPVAREKPMSHTADELYWCFRRIQGFEAWREHGPWLLAKDRGLGPGVRERFEAGAQVTLGEVESEGERRKDFRRELAALLGEEGILVLPTAPSAAPYADADGLDLFREQALRLLCRAGVSGFPQVTVPLGTSEGAPFGISLLGPPGSDLRLVALAGRIAGAA